MSLFDLIPDPPAAPLRPVASSRIYPCQRCSRNVSVVATGDPGRPWRMTCDGCESPPAECTCTERILYQCP
jgi:hypothetical protein